VVNKAGWRGGEGFLDFEGARGNPHKLVIIYVQPVTTPLATHSRSMEDITPVPPMLALDDFVLGHARPHIRTAKDLLRCDEGSSPGHFKMGCPPALKQEIKSSRRGSKNHLLRISPTFLQGGRERRVNSRVTSTPCVTIRSSGRQMGWPAMCGRSACRRPSRSIYKENVRRLRLWYKAPDLSRQASDMES